MTIDWNWFFAAFAQCGAALIAIIGAFVISKLLGESEKQEMQSSQVDEMIIHYKDLVKRISVRHFRWYDRQNITYSSGIEDAIKNGEFKGLKNDEMLEKVFELEPDLFKTEDCLIVLKERMAKIAVESTDSGGGHFAFNHILSQNISVTPPGLWDKLDQEKEAVNQLKIESETLIEQFTKIKDHIAISRKNLAPIKTTIYILVIGLLLTVIYPLHFMPIGINEHPSIGFSFKLVSSQAFSIRGLLLIILAIVIGGLFGYFIWLISRIEKNYNQVQKKLEDKFFDISTYSKYF